MKPRFSKKRNQALTLVEVVVILAILVLFAFLLCSITDTSGGAAGSKNKLRQQFEAG
jgi:competence protein ComGC